MRENFVDIVRKLRTAVGNPPEMARKFMAEGVNEIERLRKSLTSLAVMHRYRAAEGGGQIFIGKLCEVCDAEVDGLLPLLHRDDCPLSVLNDA